MRSTSISSESIIEKSAPLILSCIGRVKVPAGPFKLRPFASPAITRMLFSPCANPSPGPKGTTLSQCWGGYDDTYGFPLLELGEEPKVLKALIYATENPPRPAQKR